MGISLTQHRRASQIFFSYQDPTHYHPDAEGCRGDNDPLDVCEIGARIIDVGVSHFLCSASGVCCLLLVVVVCLTNGSTMEGQ
jgi:inorganic pyrophosphatase